MKSINGPLRIGIGGPVGAGKTTLTAAIIRNLHPHLSVGVITNDIYHQSRLLLCDFEARFAFASMLLHPLECKCR